VFRGWLVVAAAFVILFIAYGAQYSFGIFLSALLDEFHWRRASVAGTLDLRVLYPMLARSRAHDGSFRAAAR